MKHLSFYSGFIFKYIVLMIHFFQTTMDFILTENHKKKKKKLICVRKYFEVIYLNSNDTIHLFV